MMSEYDWIQWYVVFSVIWGIVDAVGKDGEIAKPKVHRFSDHFLSLMFALPFVGRILKWW